MITEIVLDVGNDSPRKAILARPERPGVGPGVVVVHDIFGMQEDTRRHCRRFAEAGYVAIAPDLMGEGSPTCTVSTIASALREEGPAFAIIEAARAVLVEQGPADPARIGITGFCLGGGFALLAAADGAYAVAAPFYGRVPRSAERLRGICPTIGQFGAQDLIFRPDAARLPRHLEALGVPHEVIVHEGAGHSFMNDHPFLMMKLGPYGPLRARYDAPTEAVAWERLLGFFAEHMGAP